MILPNTKFLPTANIKLKYFAIDSYRKCLNKEYFLNYPHEIEYLYNSRGFRGPEWPPELSNIYWCVGDSFTSGVGSPYKHSWPHVLSTKLSIPALNVSLSGGSNMWIARKIVEILEIQPKYIIAQWTYIHRRETEDIGVLGERKQLWYLTGTDPKEDIQNTIDCISSVETNKKNTTVIHTFVPKNVPDEYQSLFKELIEKMSINVVWFDQLDYARDYHHYDIKTSTNLVEKIIASKYINI